MFSDPIQVEGTTLKSRVVERVPLLRQAATCTGPLGAILDTS